MMLERDLPANEGDPMLKRGDSASAVSWVNRAYTHGMLEYRGSTGLVMRLLGRLERGCYHHNYSGWGMVAKQIPEVENKLTDGISMWPHLKRFAVSWAIVRVDIHPSQRKRLTLIRYNPGQEHSRLLFQKPPCLL